MGYGGEVAMFVEPFLDCCFYSQQMEKEHLFNCGVMHKYKNAVASNSFYKGIYFQI